MKYLKYIIGLIILINLFAVVSVAKAPPKDSSGSSDDVAQRFGNAACFLVYIAKNLMGAMFLVLIILAAIVYAGGQLLGAETRARATVWATAMFMGAIIGGIIYLLIPAILNQLMFGGDGDITQCCQGQTLDAAKCGL